MAVGLDQAVQRRYWGGNGFQVESGLTVVAKGWGGSEMPES